MADTGAPWNIPYVEGTDLVSDWPTDSLALANAIASGLDGAGGTRFIAKASVSAVSSITFDDVFTTDYQNYFVYMALTGSASGTASLQFRAGGVNTTTSNYRQQGLSFQNTTVSAALTTATSLQVGGVYSDTYQTNLLWITRPQMASRTSGWRLPMQSGGASVFANNVGPFDIDLSTQFDGFQLTPNTGTITGNAYVYGFAEA